MEMDVHERSIEIFLKLAERGVITVYDAITQDMALRVRDRLATAQAYGIKELVVNIQSDGGSYASGLVIHDMIRAYPAATRTGIALGYAHSMGVIILQACDVRWGTRHAKFLLHNIIVNEEIPLQAFRDPKEMKLLLKSAEEQQRSLETILMKRTGRTLTEIRRVCDRDVEMTSVQALDFGLIDSIRD